MPRIPGKKRGPYCGRKDYTPATKKTFRIALTAEEKQQHLQHASAINRKSRQKRKATVEGRAKSLLYDARTRAKKEGVECSITEQWIADKIRAAVCERSGVNFDLASSPKYRTPAYAPSLDRIEAGKGYTPENVRCVVWIYNAAKSEYSDQELLDFAFKLIQYQLRIDDDDEDLDADELLDDDEGIDADELLDDDEGLDADEILEA